MKYILIKVLLTGCLSIPLLAQAQHFGGQPSTGIEFGHQTFHSNSFIDRSLEQPPWQVVQEDAYISKAQAIKIARQRTDAKILSAELKKKNKHAYYKIKVLTDSGRIKTLRINAQAR